MFWLCEKQLRAVMVLSVLVEIIDSHRAGYDKTQNASSIAVSNL